MAQKGFVEHLDTAAFDKAISDAAKAQSAFLTARSTFERTSGEILSNWQGHGRDAFNDAYKRINTKLKDEQDNLDVFIKELEKIKQSYMDWDSGSAKNIQGQSNK